ncbi:hypothetical protein BpHYR1_021029 [Brachionus plicatilis]|uniref:Uncharacterized protein n=1 Tax=Brachionus plicatilis TaxID=10195 RepID=A0A3M7SH98_BRAPC|nr:hypothetical protein BpHYR1_021029 [Brachionus plicatilis]
MLILAYPNGDLITVFYEKLLTKKLVTKNLVINFNDHQTGHQTGHQTVINQIVIKDQNETLSLIMAKKNLQYEHSQLIQRECLNFSASKATAIQRGSAVKQVLFLNNEFI